MVARLRAHPCRAIMLLQHRILVELVAGSSSHQLCCVLGQKGFSLYGIVGVHFENSAFWFGGWVSRVLSFGIFHFQDVCSLSVIDSP